MYLNCHTNFSLRYGTLSPEELVNLARENGVETLALTDIHSSSAVYDFVRLCREAGIHPVVGMEFRRGDELLYIALARNFAAFRQLNDFYSRYAQQKRPFPELPPRWDDVYIIYPWERQHEVSLGEQEFLGVRPDQLRQLVRSRFGHRPEQLVAWSPVTFANKRGHNIHRLLRAIDHNTLLSKLGAHQQAGDEATFLTPDEMRERYAEHRHLLSNAERILADCDFDFEFGQRLSRQTFTGGKYEDMILLEKLARDGLKQRYSGRRRQQAEQRLRGELDIIDKLDFNAYFLITWDFVNYGRSRDFFHVGRGSGANSITAYCLGITDVDPIELDLYFERFLNPRRSSPPDFDIDYSWKDRDEVIDYIFRRYRHSHTALLATYNCFRSKAVLRELGKVFGMPKREIDLLVATRNAPANGQDSLGRQVMRYAGYLDGFPNHLSIHAGGILISEAPIHSYTATDLPPKGFPITQFDMYVAEEIGLHKFDVLSQRGLGHIRESVELVRQNRGLAVDIHDVDRFKKDEPVKQLLRDGNTLGCFYVESPAMRMLLKKLQCEDYPTLVAASSIIRPGVARSGMMQAYIRRHNKEPFQWLHPKLQELLHDTYGVMVYQEDVIKVAHYFAGLDLAEADLLRRAMSGKFRTRREFDEIAERFFSNCRERGYDEAVVEEIWRQIESFAAYSFSKAHSASFAVESFQSLFLKAHYPLEFMTAVINNFGGFYDTEIYVREAMKMGGKVHLPHLNESEFHTTIKGEDIYLGFVHLKDLESGLAHEIVAERQRRGPFRDLADLMRRLGPPPEQINILIRIGALRFTGLSKAQLMWDSKLRSGQQAAKKGRQADVLFEPEPQGFALPELPDDPVADAYDQMELLGFTLQPPFALTPQIPEGALRRRDFPAYRDQLVQCVAYLVCVKHTRTIKGEDMFFANFIDGNGEPVDVTIFPSEARKYALSGRGVYLLAGKVVEEFGTWSLEMKQAKKLAYVADPRNGS